MPTALITGINGQDGRYLTELLVDKGYSVHGVTRDSARRSLDDLRSMATMVEVDLSSDSAIRRLIEDVQPDEIYNLAAVSSLEEAEADPIGTADLNGSTPGRFLEAIIGMGAERHTRFCQASSSQIFGPPDGSLRDEQTPIRPHNVYAEAKAKAQLTVARARTENGVFATAAILFNHESPRRSTRFVSRKISTGVARIAAGFDSAVQLRNLGSSRDWGFAGDYVNAMWLMLQQDSPDDYVIASGALHTVEDFVREAFTTVGISDWGRFVVTAGDAVEIGSAGDPRKATSELGWSPRVSFGELVTLMVEHDLSRLGNNGYQAHNS